MLAVVFVAAVAAFLVSAFAGGGAGLILLPMLALVLPAVSVPAALSIGSTLSSVSRLALFRRHIRWDVVRWFLPGFAGGRGLPGQGNPRHPARRLAWTKKYRRARRGAAATGEYRIWGLPVQRVIQFGSI
ncbi:MAG TPA: TSUP family transporter [Pinirhizobacter sp.]|uniref:TSUP family transporter n=1 Tax=Pinirhizobacter sp. TaxID=2950432 RepID=UPI002BE8902F|nr:TSUP family transporter [Pinirhizobacter sp.]HMH66584.1 TSUP family transporter [Pinirhizobacter sp.]